MAARLRGDATLGHLKQSYYENLIGLELARRQQNEAITIEGIQTNLSLIGELIKFAIENDLKSAEMLQEQERVYHQILDGLRDGSESIEDIYSMIRDVDKNIDSLLKNETPEA